MNYNNVYFFTATIKEWKYLLKPDKYKDIIVNSLRYLVNNKRVTLFSFVIMPNHIHIIWRILDGHTKSDVQRDFLKYVAQQIKFDLIDNHPKVLKKFKVDLIDREYQFWQYRPLSIDIYTDKVFIQKLEYIHNNPIQDKWKLSNLPQNYRYSSASFYLENKSEWEFLRNYMKY